MIFTVIFDIGVFRFVSWACVLFLYVLWKFFYAKDL